MLNLFTFKVQDVNPFYIYLYSKISLSVISECLTSCFSFHHFSISAFFWVKQNFICITVIPFLVILLCFLARADFLAVYFSFFLSQGIFVLQFFLDTEFWLTAYVSALSRCHPIHCLLTPWFLMRSQLLILLRNTFKW